MPVVGPSRRVFLAAGLSGLGAALSGCTGGGSSPAPERSASPTPTVDPDDAVRERAVGSERALLDAYAAVLAAFPGLAGRLSPVVDEHTAHLAALGGDPPDGAAASSPAQASAVPSGTGVPPPSEAPPPDRTTALAELAAAERAAADDRAGDTLDASPGLARLLAGIGASEAVHAALLAEGA